MIIVEGPDGAGKTTLISRLTSGILYDVSIGPRASHSTNGPVDDLSRWVDTNLLSWGHSELKIYDRYPLISEPIYGSIIRGEVDSHFTDKWLRHRLNTFRSMTFVIWCIPPLKVVRANVTVSDHETPTQMDGVAMNIDAIWSLYAMHAQMWIGPAMIYDYTKSNSQPRDTQLVSMLRRHQISWRHFS